MYKVEFDISKTDNADALNWMCIRNEEIICESFHMIPGDLDTVMLVGTQDGTISVHKDWIIEIKGV